MMKLEAYPFMIQLSSYQAIMILEHACEILSVYVCVCVCVSARM